MFIKYQWTIVKCKQEENTIKSIKKPHPILHAIPMALADAIFINVSILLSAMLASYFFKGQAPLLAIFRITILPIGIGTVIIFALLGAYRTLWQYITLTSLLRLAFACFLASFFSYGVLRIVAGYWQPPIIAVTIFYLFTTLSIGLRSLPSLYGMWQISLNRGKKKRALIPVLLVGAGSSADLFIKNWQAQYERKYRIVGLVDDDSRKQRQTLRGIPVRGNTNDIPELVKQYGVQEIIIAIPTLSSNERKRIMSICLPTGCVLRTMGNVLDVQEYDGNASLKELNIADLLGRDEIYLDKITMSNYIGDAVVLVTGGGGSIGSELCRQIMNFHPKKLIIFDMYENNAYDIFQELRMKYPDQKSNIVVRVGSVQDASRLKDVFEEFHPELVFHAAAYKHVPLMEQCPRLAVENNIFGSYQLAITSAMYHVKRFVMISTDKAVNPTNVMGASKRISEILLQSLNGQGTEFVAVRFGNVLGSNGSVVPIFRQQIENGGPVTITDPDIIRYFMTIPEATRLVLQAGAMAQGGETFILDMGEPVRILDLAETMIKMAGLEPHEDIEIVYTGLRPGEKLFEELLLKEEGIQKTESDKIFVAHGDPISETERTKIISQLRLCLETNDDVKACIQNILPTYTPDLQNNEQ